MQRSNDMMYWHLEAFASTTITSQKYLAYCHINPDGRYAGRGATCRSDRRIG